MEVDSLLCLNSVEKSSFEMLRLKNNKSLGEILKTLEESIDSAVHDANEDEILLKSKQIQNSLESNNSSAVTLGNLIDIVSTTIEELKDISGEKNTNNLKQSESNELIMLTDDQPTLKISANNSEKNDEISSRYPELFEIFSDNSQSQFSNFSLNSETEIWDTKKIQKSSKTEEPEKDLIILNSIIEKKILSKNIKKDILPEKLENNSLEKLQGIKESSISNFKTLPIQAKLKNSEKSQILTKKNKSRNRWKVLENRPSLMIKRITSSLENLPPLSPSTMLSSRTDTSNSSLNSWKTLKDTPRSNHDNYSEVNFTSKSINELEMKSMTKSEIKRGRLKLKTGDKTKKKKKLLSTNVERIQGDIEIELKKSRVLVPKIDMKINNEELKGKINILKEKEIEENNVLMDVFDILVDVKSSLFKNRKLAQSIQERFQNCSVLQTIISDNSINLLNEGISICSKSIESREYNQDLIIGANDLLMDSVFNIMQAVKGEEHYLKQQEYYYCEHFSGSTNRKIGNLKKSTKHTLIGNDSTLLLNQKDKIEELISYTISLIKKIVPKKTKEKNIDYISNSTIRNSRSYVKTNDDSQGQKELFFKSRFENSSDFSTLSKSENKKIVQKNIEDKKEIKVSESRLDTIFNKSNQESSKIVEKYSSNDKFTRSSTQVIRGSCNDSKKSLNQVKSTNKGRFSKTNQPIWRPAGSAKVPVPLQSLSRQKTRSIISTSDKKKEKQNEEITSAKNISTVESSIRNLKSRINKSSTNFKSSDLVKKSDIKFPKGNFKKETEVKLKSQTRKTYLISKDQKNSCEENLELNQDFGKIKRKSTQIEAIKILKELIKSTSEEEIKNCEKTIKSSCSSLASVPIKNSSKIESNLQNSQVNKLKKTENKNDFSKPGNKSKIILKTNSARTPSSESEISSAKLSTEYKISSARLLNSKSKDIIKENKLEKETRNESLNSLKSNLYLKKNGNNSSYLQSYIKMNSRQSLDLNNSQKSLREKSEIKEDNSQNEEIKFSKEIEIQDDLILINSEPERDFSQSSKVCNDESLTKVSSSKFCQVSLESSICSKINDSKEISETEVNSSAEELNAKSEIKFVNKHTKPLLILKDILQQHGLDIDLVDEAEKKLRSKQKGFSKSIYLGRGEGTLLAVCSSQTLFNKLATLSDSSFEELEIIDAMNQCSLESFNQDLEILESQEYFLKSETSLNSSKVNETENFVSIGINNKKDATSSPEQKINVLSQTISSDNKSEECQTSFVNNADTSIEKTILMNLFYNDAEISCNLENSIVLKKEAGTDIPFRTFCYEVETQTKINPEKGTITDFGKEINLFKVDEIIQTDYFEEETIFDEDSIFESKISYSQGIFEESDNIEKDGIKSERNSEIISISNSDLSSKSEFFIEKSSESEEENNSNSCNSSSKSIQEYKNENKSQKKLISKLEIIPSFIIFGNKSEEISMTKSSKLKMEKKMKNTNFKDSKNSIDLENLSTKEISTINYFPESKKMEIFRECKSCGRISSNSNNSSRFEISTLGIVSELFRAKNQDLIPIRTISSDNNSLPKLMKYKNRKTQKFIVEPQNRLSQNLAVTTLKLATKRAQDLYEDVVICRQSLTSRKSLKGIIKCPVEKFEEDKLNLKLTAKRKKEAGDFFQENESNFQSKTLGMTLEDLKKKEISLALLLEISDVMNFLLENVKKKLEKENIDVDCKIKERNDERKNCTFQLKHRTFFKSDLLTIIYITVTMSSIIFWCLYSIFC